MLIAMIARLGSARPMLEMLIARNEPLWMCPSQIPSGIAISRAMPIAAAAMPSWSIALVRRRWAFVSDEPERVPEVVHAALPARAQGVSARWASTSGRVGGQRERDGQTPGGDDLGLEDARLDGVEDRSAQAVDADVGGDGGEADHRHGRDPQPRHDRGQRQGQLNAPEQLALGEAHAARRLEHLLGDPRRPSRKLRNRISSV